VKLFGEHGIDVPDLAPVTRTAILGFPSTGQDALNWWQRLHAIGERTGYWPLLTDPDLAESLDRPTTDAVLARATELDGAEVLGQPIRLRLGVRQILPGQWGRRVRGRQSGGAGRQPHRRGNRHRLVRLGCNRTFAWLATRTRSYDDAVTEALDAGITQAVIVAAGYDSRAWRLAAPPHRPTNGGEHPRAALLRAGRPRHRLATGRTASHRPPIRPAAP
jgi:hypothetical protein